jgi:D-lyxose ketol-isomerase
VFKFLTRRYTEEAQRAAEKILFGELFWDIANYILRHENAVHLRVFSVLKISSGKFKHGDTEEAQRAAEKILFGGLFWDIAN